MRPTRLNACCEAARCPDCRHSALGVRFAPAIWACMVALAAGAVITLAGAQRQMPGVLESGEPLLFSAAVEVVNVTATVQDANKRFVTDLEKGDFVLREDGVVQDIRYFRRHTDAALNVGLLVDTSGSQVLLLEEERSTGSLFFRAVLRQDLDNAFVMTFDREFELLQDFTSSFDELEGGSIDGPARRAAFPGERSSGSADKHGPL